MQPTRPAADARPATLDVALLPPSASSEHTRRSQITYIVVDVIRATTTLSVLFEHGCAQVLLAPSIEQARAARDTLGADYLLAGEVGGARPAGFDLGNSPPEIARADLRGRSVIFATTNGTRALRSVAGGRAVFAGCLRNASAVCAASVASWLDTPEGDTPSTTHVGVPGAATGGASEAEVPARHPDIVVVCSGRVGQPAYDDTLCAGYLVRDLVRSAGARNRSAQLTENARIALGVLDAAEHHGPLRNALASADAARAIARIGLADDLDWCAATDISEIVPALVDETARDGLLVLRALPHNG